MGSVRQRVVGGLIAVGLVLTATWYVVGERTLAQVRFDAALPVCDGVGVTRWNETDDEMEPFLLPTIPMAEGMDCVLTYRIANDSGRTLRLTRFVYPFGGPGGGAGYRVDGIHGTPIDDRDVDGVPDGGREIDAIWSDGQDLVAHQEVDLQVHVRFRADGCSGLDVRQWARPVATVGFLGWREQIAGPQAPVWQGTRDSSCDE